MEFTVWLLLACCAIALAKPGTKEDTCGYQSCPAIKPEMLNVHLVPHTHDDVGWLKTVDQYFYGHRNDIYRTGVTYILDSVIQELLDNPNRRFIWVETAFLWQWWLEQDDDLRTQVISLVNNGQLEITGGAWSMHDEAVTHYHSILDQFTWGFKKLRDTFGACGQPRIGWQIDPFGHSRESASMMAQMGFDALFFARLDYQDKEHRRETKTSEFVWQASANLGDKSWLFTHALYSHYSPPSGFCFDIGCREGNEPFIDNPRSPDYNVVKRVDDFLDYVTKQAEYYVTNNIIILMGDDFHYQSAHMWFKNLDKLIKYVNERQNNGSNVNVFYSSPSCYVKAVNEADLTWTTKQDDFFPYQSKANAYWTGYFTSRPTLKYFERQSNNLLQVTKQLMTLAQLPEENWTDLASLREMMGVMQHHDAITGTEKQHVAEDYALRLAQAAEDAHKTVGKALNTLMAKSSSSPVVSMEACPLLNISSCGVTENNERFVVTAYNPLSRENSMYLRLPVIADDNTNYQVFEPLGSEIQSQLVPIPQAVLNIPGRESSATFELVFRAVDVPPLGYTSYYVQGTTQKSDKSTRSKISHDKYFIGNEHLKARFDEKTGHLAGISLKGKTEMPLEQTFWYYHGNVGFRQSSGAYVFRPGKQPIEQIGPIVNITTVSGTMVEEIHQQFSPWVTQVIRSYMAEEYLEFEWLVGPIDVDDEWGKEIVTRYSTGWATDGLFYTDSNGREILERKRNYRPTWEVDIKEPESGNYYPVTTFISVKNENNYTLAVLTDRAQGGSSLQDGEIELMVHRRLLVDDEFGVGEALNERVEYDSGEVGLVARGRHILVMGNGEEHWSIRGQQRQFSQSRMVLPLWLMMAPTQLSLQEWKDQYNMKYTGVAEYTVSLSVQVTTLEPWGENNRALLRLEHCFEKGEDLTLSIPAQVYLEEILSDFTVVWAQEMTLGGSLALGESERLSWKVQADSSVTEQEPRDDLVFLVKLQPMEIRTFVVELQPRP